MSKRTLRKEIHAKGSFIVLNDKGLHTRPSTEIVRCASSFKATVELIYQELCVNAKSILGILMLAAAKGAKIKIQARGEDAKQAVGALLALAREQFKVKY